MGFPDNMLRKTTDN